MYRKSIILLFFNLSFFLVACENFIEHDVEIKNESDYTVSFQLKGYGEDVYTLKNNEAITLKIFNNPTLIFQGHPRVRYESTDSVKIYNLTAYTYQILNNSSTEIILKEANGLLGNSYEDKLTLAPADSVNIIVYTKKPIWRAFYTSNEKMDALCWLSIIRF